MGICVSKLISLTILFMSDWDSSDSSSSVEGGSERSKWGIFDFEYFLSTSFDCLGEWADLVTAIPPDNFRLSYLRKEYPFIKRCNLIRIAETVRGLAFMHQLQHALEAIKQQYQCAFSTGSKLQKSKAKEGKEEGKEEEIEAKLPPLKGQKEISLADLNATLLELVDYLQCVVMVNLVEFEKKYTRKIGVLLQQILYYIVDPLTIWKVLNCLHHYLHREHNILLMVSLGGNFVYYKNQLRGLTSKDTQLSELISQFPQLEERQHKKDILVGLVRAVEEGAWDRKEKHYFVTVLKGLCFEREERARESLLMEYLFASFHISHLESSKKYIDYGYYESLFCQVLRRAKEEKEYFQIALHLEVEFIPIPRRTKGACIERHLLDILKDYIAHRKRVSGVNSGLHSQPPNESANELHITLESTRQLADPHCLGMFLSQLRLVQKESRCAFQYGDVEMHCLYLQLAKLLREMYLSFKEDVWLYPSQILRCLSLSLFIGETKADVKTVLYKMASNLNEGSHGRKVEQQQVRKVSAEQYLNVMLMYMQDCESEQMQINLPEVMPSSMETSILYVRSLHLRTKDNKPSAEQIVYHKLLLGQCEKRKVYLPFQWYKPESYTMDREMEYNMTRGLPQEWMRKIVKTMLARRDKEHIKGLLERVSQGSLVEIANYLKYHQGYLNVHIDEDEFKKNINQVELFSLIEEMRLMLTLQMGDIFTLTQDDEINLNYLHACLGLYNYCFKQATGSGIYSLIVQNIMKPYLAASRSQAIKFRETYPNFFSKWIYTEHIPILFQELSGLILLNADVEDTRAKMELVYHIIDNKDAIRDTLKEQQKNQLLQAVGAFASVFHSETHPDILLCGSEILAYLLTAFDFIKDVFSLHVVLSHEILSRTPFVRRVIESIREKKDSQDVESDQFVLKYMLTELPNYMHKIGLHFTLKIIKEYVHCCEQSVQISQLSDAVLKRAKDDTQLVLFLKWLFQMKSYIESYQNIADLFSGAEETAVRNEENAKVMSDIMSKLKQLPQDDTFSNVKFTKLVFLEEIMKDLKDPEMNQKGKEVLAWVLSKYGSNEDLMYFADELNMEELLINKEKEERFLIDLIVEDYHQKSQTKIIKKLLRTNKMSSEPAAKAIEGLTKVNSDHINRLVHINNRYPNAAVESFLLQHIGQDRHPDSIKISQPYLSGYLSKAIAPLPHKICESILFNPLEEKCYEQLESKINEVFEKLLYLPIKKFEKISFLGSVKEEVAEEGREEVAEGKQEDHGKDEDWESEEGEEEKPKRSKSKRKESVDVDVTEAVDAMSANSASSSEIAHSQSDRGSNYGSDNSGNIAFYLRFFTEDDEQSEAVFKKYGLVMLLREALDIYIEGDYSRLKQTDLYIKEKLIAISQLINQFPVTFLAHHVRKLPPQLYEALREYKLKYQIEDKIKQSIIRERKPQHKLPQYNENAWQEDGRDQSEDSSQSLRGYDEDDDEDDEDDDEDDEDDEDDQQAEIHQVSYNRQRINRPRVHRQIIHRGNSRNSDSDSRYDSSLQNEGTFARQRNRQRMEQAYIEQRRPRRGARGKTSYQRDTNLIKKKDEEEDQEMDVPTLLLPSYSKVQSQIVGGELSNAEIIKLMEIALYKVLVLPNSQIKTRQISSFYLQLLDSELGGVFMDSLLTVLRMEEEAISQYIRRKKEAFERDASQKALTDKKSVLGLQEISFENATFNAVFLLEEHMKAKASGDILYKDRTALLPIAEDVITRFALPTQKSVLTMLFLYIEHRKTKLRTSIEDLEFPNEIELSPEETERLINRIWSRQCSSRVWSVMKNQMNITFKSMDKLLSCINGYGRSLFIKLSDTGIKILKQLETDTSLQNNYHVVSKLIIAQKKAIKQFYFVNKEALTEIFNDQDNGNHLPACLLKHKTRLLNNSQLMRLTELSFYFINNLKEKFYNKIEGKMFKKLIHYPKMVIEAAWMYVFIFAKKSQFKWRPPTEVASIFQNHKIGEYKFTNLQDVCNLVLHFLDLESFCNDQFRSILIPHFLKEHQIGRQVPLIFKTHNYDDGSENQDIVVSRKCSFDMAFYQFTGKGIHVQYHNEEGSDHGGLVREFMIGWKGKGVGQEEFFLGKILGVSFLHKIPYGGTIELPMLVAITQYVPTIEIFKEIDMEIYNSLKYIRDNDPESLCLNMVIPRDIYGIHKNFELVPGGEDIELTKENKEEYLRQYPIQYFWAGRERELKEVQAGFYTIVNPKLAMIFTPFQMLRQIRGEEIVDTKILKTKAKYDSGYTEDSEVIKWLWEILDEFPQAKMNRFIQFVTGSPKITVYNREFDITFDQADNPDRLPVAHTCFNTLDLPAYPSKEILNNKLTLAIMEGNDSFGMA